MKKVVGFGKTNVDLLYTGMPRVPREGEEIYAQGFSMQLGGGVPATLINLGRLSVPCQIQTLLGKDQFSAFAKGQFEGNGVTPHNLYQGDGMPVNLTSAVITPRDRAFISYSDDTPITQQIQKEALALSQGADIVLMQEELLPIYQTLKDQGSLLVYDTGWREDMSLASMEEVLLMADWYTPNDKEAMKITGTDSPQAAARVLADFFETVVIKLGKEGCLLYQHGWELIVPAMPDVPVVDTTGAGDAFLAGFTYGLFHGAEPALCALYGNITGGTCVQAVGCLGSYVTEEELLKKADQMKALLRG
ncbi:MAG: carbohydrate kinase family protein [Clostridiales bacterium]|nr:carbohydrate kinase family protein [Clostridiales bacterium]